LRCGLRRTIFQAEKRGYFVTDVFDALDLKSGARVKNRFALAPLTNLQSHGDGRLGDDEFKWLAMRAEGGFGLVMTCAASVSHGGIGFAGQLGIYDDKHLEGLTRLAAALKAPSTGVVGAHAVVQLHHGGMRAPQELTGAQPVCPSDNAETGARAMTREEIERVRDDFITAARRAQIADFDGVELHGAHGYLICQFFSAEINQRDDSYGGSLENRTRLLFEIIDGVRAVCGSDFSLGVRLSPERFGLQIGEILDLAQRLMNDPRIDYVDMSLWDVFAEPKDDAYSGKSLLAHFAALTRGKTRLGVAGKIASADDAARALAEGVDFVFLGNAGIFHHDFPKRVAADPHFSALAKPVSKAHLRAEGVGEAFLTYLSARPGTVSD
jgi:2,4-dienoyl-CoA reductase-like NADH-dependent reductase (Old Yellow Enzyme family)